MADESLTANLNLTATDSASGIIKSGAQRVRESLKEYERAVKDVARAEKDSSSDATRYFSLRREQADAWARLQRAQTARLAEDTAKAEDKKRREIERTHEKERRATADAISGYDRAGSALLRYAGRFATVGAIVEATRRSFLAFADQDRQMATLQTNMRLTANETARFAEESRKLGSQTGLTNEQLTESFSRFRSQTSISFNAALRLHGQLVQAANNSGTALSDWEKIGATASRAMKDNLNAVPGVIDGWRATIPQQMVAPFADGLSQIVSHLDKAGVKIGPDFAHQLGAAFRGVEGVLKSPQDAAKGIVDALSAATDTSTNFGKIMEGETRKLKAGQIDLITFLHRAQEEAGRQLLFVEGQTGERARAHMKLTEEAVKALKAPMAGLREEAERSQKAIGGIAKESEKLGSDATGSINRLSTSFTGLGVSAGKAIDAIGGSNSLRALSAALDLITKITGSATPGKPAAPGAVVPGRPTRSLMRIDQTQPAAGTSQRLLDRLLQQPQKPSTFDERFGFATGGEFVVPGSGGTDTTPVEFMATPGEKVSIDPQGGRQESLQVQQDKADQAMREHFARFHRSDRARVAALSGDLGGMYDAKGNYTGKGGPGGGGGGTGGGGGDPAAGTRTGTGGGGGQASGTGGGGGGPPGIPGVGGVPLNTPVGLDPASATGPAETLEDAYKRGYLKPPTAEAAAGGSPGQVIYQKLLAEFKNSSLIGKVPADGARFGIKTGSAEEWARFGTAVSNEESSFRSKTVGPKSDPGGSYGIFQYAHGQVDGNNAFDDDASIKAFVRDATASSKNLASGILGRRISVISLKPERTIRSLPLAEKLAAGAKAGTTSAAPPITTAELGAALQGTTPAGDIRLGEKGAHGYTRGGVTTEPWLVDTVRQASKALPEGYRAEVISTVDPRTTGTKWHPGGRAIDIQIYDKDNKPVTNVGKKEGTPEYAVYERMALAARQYAEQKYPGQKFIWGGHFNSGTPYDLMHFQSTGAAARGFSKQQLATPVLAPDVDKTKVAGPAAISDIETRAAARYKAAQERVAAAPAAPAAPEEPDYTPLLGGKAAGKGPRGRTWAQEARRIRRFPYVAPAGEGRAAGKGVAPRPVPVVRPVSAPGQEERAAGKGRPAPAPAPAEAPEPEGKAYGGNVYSGQQYLVGEKGPEFFTPGDSGGRIGTDPRSYGRPGDVGSEEAFSTQYGDTPSLEELSPSIAPATRGRRPQSPEMMPLGGVMEARSMLEKPIEPIIRPRIQNLGPASMRWTRHAERNRDQDNTRRAAREAHTDLGFA